MPFVQFTYTNSHVNYPVTYLIIANTCNACLQTKPDKAVKPSELRALLKPRANM